MYILRNFDMRNQLQSSYKVVLTQKAECCTGDIAGLLQWECS